MMTVSVFLVVFAIAVCAHLLAVAAADFAAARTESTDGGPSWPRRCRNGALVVEAAAFIGILASVHSGDANPLIFEFFVLQVIGALMAHDAQARGEWRWSGRVHALFAVLAIIAVLSGRYSVVLPGLPFAAGVAIWISAIAALVLGLVPILAYLKARGPRLDGLTPTVRFVKGVMGASADTFWMALPRYIIACVILGGIVINGANVIGRYVYLSPIIWAEELMIYGMVWTVFVGAVLVTWDSRHLKMDLVSNTLPSPWKEILNGISVLAFLAVCVFVVPQNWTVFHLMIQNDQRSIVAEIPMSIPHFALLLGFVLMFLAVLFRARRQITGEMESSEIDDLVAGEVEGSTSPAPGE